MSVNPSGSELPAAALAALRQGNKIAAIKVVRAETGLGLKEAKDAVEDYARAHPVEPGTAPMQRGDPNSGRTWLLVVVTVAVLVGCYFFFGR